LVAPFVITGQDKINCYQFVNGNPFLRWLTPTNSRKLIFGHPNGEARAVISQVRIFNRFLSLEEIALLYMENPAVKKEDYKFLSYIGKPELLYVRGTDILDLLVTTLGFSWPSYNVWRILEGKDAFSTDLYLRFGLLEVPTTREVTITGEFEIDYAPSEKGYVIKNSDTSSGNLDVRLAIDTTLQCYAEASFNGTTVATDSIQLAVGAPYRFAVRHDGQSLVLRLYDPKEGKLLTDKRVNLPSEFSTAVWNSSTITTAKVPGKATLIRFFDNALTDEELDILSLQEFYVKEYKIPMLLLFGSTPLSDGIVLYYPMNKPDPEYKVDEIDVSVTGLKLTTDKLMGYTGSFTSLEIKGVSSLGPNITISFKTKASGELIKASDEFVLAANYIKVGSQTQYFSGAGVVRHYCLACEGKAAKLYVNGKLAWTGTLPKALNEYQSLTVSASPLAELRLYKKVLNEDEVKMTLRRASFR
jgi:hypothetical protein